jgi:site-specific recombinase XerD
MTTQPKALTSAELEAARMLLARLGIAPEQLLNSPTRATSMPTFDEYIDRVSQAVTDGTRKVNTTYWRRVREFWGARHLDEVTALEIKQLTQSSKSQLVTRRNSRGGRSAGEHIISALRCLYSYAVADGLIAEGNNPAVRVAKPRRLACTRRAILP